MGAATTSAAAAAIAATGAIHSDRRDGAIPHSGENASPATNDATAPPAGIGLAPSLVAGKKAVKRAKRVLCKRSAKFAKRADKLGDRLHAGGA